MAGQLISRRRLLQLGASGGLAGVLGRAGARTERDGARRAEGAGQVAVGVVLPLPNRASRVDPGSQALAGQAARRGARMAEEDFAGSEDHGGLDLRVQVSTAPDAASAFRAGQRLARAEGVSALVGGLGLEQARALARLAQQEEIPLLNIGAASDALRDEENASNVLHVECAASTYLAALVSSYARNGAARWFLVSGSDDEGRALRRAASSAIASIGGEEAGAYDVADLSDHPSALEEIRTVAPDVVLLLQDWRGQLDFLGHYEARGLPYPVTGFPDPVSQTRDFLASAVRAASRAAAAARLSLWEAHSHPEARALGERFIARWGTPMDPSAWAAYVSISLLVSAVYESGRSDGPDLVDWLRCRRGLNIYKGEAAHFGADGQLRQPLYLIRPDPEARELRESVQLLEVVPSG